MESRRDGIFHTRSGTSSNGANNGSDCDYLIQTQAKGKSGHEAKTSFSVTYQTIEYSTNDSSVLLFNFRFKVANST